MMASTPSLHEAATGSVNRNQTPTTPPADTLGDDDSSSDSSIPSDDDQFLESLKTDLYCKLLKKNKDKHKIVLPPGFLAPKSRDCWPSAVIEGQDVAVASPWRDDGYENPSPWGVTNSPKWRLFQKDEWKNNSSCSDNSLQPNITEEINGYALQKVPHCNYSPVKLESVEVEPAKNIQLSSEFPSFSISMKPSHVNGNGGRPRIPAEFCKRHLPNKDTTIILMGENGVEYKTLFLFRGGSRLSSGWGAFSKDHKLAVGDVLRFQLVNQTKFEVFIERSNQSEIVAEDVVQDEDAIFEKSWSIKKRNRTPRGVPVACIDELRQRLEEAEAARHVDKEAIINDMQKKYDFIINDMQKKYDSIMEAMQKVRVQAPDTLDVDSDETHHVTNPRKRRCCVKGNTPSEDGSSCDHSPFSEDSLQLNIAEITLQNGQHCNSPPNLGSLEWTKHIQSSSEFPSFSISMQPSHVVNGRKLILPAKFSKHHLPDKDTTIILKGENGVEYKTTYLPRASHGSRLSAGWAVFSDDHKLVVGDVLRFQLVNQTTFEVFIDRSNQSDEVNGALFSNQSASGAKQELGTSYRAEKHKMMKLEAKLKKISKAKDRHNGEVKKLEEMQESVRHELELLMHRGDKRPSSELVEDKEVHFKY